MDISVLWYHGLQRGFCHYYNIDYRFKNNQNYKCIKLYLINNIIRYNLNE